MNKMLKTFLPFLVSLNALFAQNIEANYRVTAIWTEYLYEIRESYPAPGMSPEDENLTYDATISWPSSAMPLYTLTGTTFVPGDTLPALWLPFPGPEYLAIAGGLITGDFTQPGIALDVFFDDSGDDAGNFSIGDGSTFPTTTTENCSTAAVISDAASVGVWEKQPGYWNNTDGVDNDGDGEIDEEDEGATYTFGNGILESSILALFQAADLVNGVYGVDYGKTPESYVDENGNGQFDSGEEVIGGENTAMPSWGKAQVTYTQDADGNNVPLTLHLYWETNPGVLEDSGIDADGLINSSLGFPTFPMDTVSVPAAIAQAMAAGVTPPNPAMGPIVGGSGLDAATAALLGMIPAEHADSTTIGWAHDHATGTLLPPFPVPYTHGSFRGNKGVYFDPSNEGLAATGGYFTFHLLASSSIFGATFQGALAQGADVPTAGAAAVTQVATFLGVDAETAASIGDAAASQSIAGIYDGCMSAPGATEAACQGAVVAAGGTLALSYVASMSPDTYVDDSDALGSLPINENFPTDPTSETYAQDIGNYILAYGVPGQLMFEVDNVCVPIHTTTRPTAIFYNTVFLETDESAPLAEKFELHGNYPNPFNPITTIKFSTEMFSKVKVTIYNTMGQEVKTLYNDAMNAGTYKLKWHGRDNNGTAVPSGMYFYRVSSNDRTLNGKMLLLK